MIKVNPPTPEEAALLESRAIMSLFWPAQNKELMDQMSKQGATVLAMDQLPRTLSRGQVRRLTLLLVVLLLVVLFGGGV